MTLPDPMPHGESGPAGNDAPPYAEPQVPIRYARDGAIDEDLFCLSCGYNLCGLTGDPVRCPECGGDNALSDVTLSAEAIRDALSNLETQPTYCVAITVVAVPVIWVVCKLPSLNHMESIVISAGIAMVAILAWHVSYSRFSATIDSPNLARWIVWRFHVTTLFVLAPILTFIAVLYIEPPMLQRRLSIGIWLGGFATPFVLIPVAMLMNRPVRKAREQAQRDTAVRIARDTLRRRMNAPGWRRR